MQCPICLEEVDKVFYYLDKGLMCEECAKALFEKDPIDLYCEGYGQENDDDGYED